MANILLFCSLMGIIPLCLGMLYTVKIKKEANGIIKNWVSGLVICFAIFDLLAISATYLEKSLSGLTFVYVTILAVLMIVSLILSRKRFPHIIMDFFQSIRRVPWVAILAILVIGYQIYMYVMYMHVDDDDSFYVATAVTAVHTDSIFQFNPYSGAAYSKFPSRYVLSPFPILVAALSRLANIHPTIMAHTVLPAILILFCYGVLTVIGYELFRKDREKTAYFVLFAAVIQMFAATTTHTQGMVMLVRIWQGKALLASALLPLVFYIGIRLIQGSFEKMDWLLLICLMLSCCLASSMGIMLGAIMTGIIGILAAIWKKNIWIMGKLLLCCIPNLFFAAVYLVIR